MSYLSLANLSLGKCSSPATESSSIPRNTSDVLGSSVLSDSMGVPVSQNVSVMICRFDVHCVDIGAPNIIRLSM